MLSLSPFLLFFYISCPPLLLVNVVPDGREKLRHWCAVHNIAYVPDNSSPSQAMPNAAPAKVMDAMVLGKMK